MISIFDVMVLMPSAGLLRYLQHVAHIQRHLDTFKEILRRKKTLKVIVCGVHGKVLEIHRAAPSWLPSHSNRSPEAR